LTLKELEEAPANVKNLVEEIPQEHKEYAILNTEARELARHYIEEGVV
jgi:hypothetical protein